MDHTDHVTIHEVGRWLRQQNVDVSDFLLLRILSEDNVRKFLVQLNFIAEMNIRMG